MQKLYFSEGLLGDCWAKDICLTLDTDGMILSVASGCSVPEGVHVYGPVLPAMANLHSHAFQRAFAGLAEYKSTNPSGGKSDFWSWREAMYGFAAHMTPGAQEIVAAALYVEMLKVGYSAVGEFHYLHNNHLDQSLAMSDAMIAAADATGIALTHLPVFYEAADFGGKPPASAQIPFVHDRNEFCRLLQILSARLSGRHQLGLAFHSLRAVAPDSFAPIIDTLDKIDMRAPIHIHIAEQTAEVEACLAHSGKRPVEWLLDSQPVNERWCLIHATHVSKQEWQDIAQSGAIVGLCPTTEANLGDGLFPLSEFIEQGGKWGIGSDSHISIDTREELRLLEYGLRLARQERSVLAGAAGSEGTVDTGASVAGHVGAFLWGSAAQGGAKALGQPIGEIAVGKRADLIVLDKSKLAFAGAACGQIMDALVFAGQPNPITDVMVAGKWVIEGGKHKDEDQIFARYQDLVGTVAAAVRKA